MRLTLSIALVIVSSLVFVGCGKQQEPTPPVPKVTEDTSLQKSVDQATGAVNETLDKATNQAEAVKASAEASVTDAKAKVEDATSQFDTIVAAIKENVAANQFDQALTGLKQGLALPNLTDAQKGILQQLQEAVQAALAKNTTATATQEAQGAVDDAAKKVGGVLQGFGK